MLLHLVSWCFVKDFSINIYKRPWSGIFSCDYLLWYQINTAIWNKLGSINLKRVNVNLFKYLVDFSSEAIWTSPFWGKFLITDSIPLLLQVYWDFLFFPKSAYIMWVFRNYPFHHDCQTCWSRIVHIFSYNPLCFWKVSTYIPIFILGFSWVFFLFPLSFYLYVFPFYWSFARANFWFVDSLYWFSILYFIYLHSNI